MEKSNKYYIDSDGSGPREHDPDFDFSDDFSHSYDDGDIYFTSHSTHKMARDSEIVVAAGNGDLKKVKSIVETALRDDSNAEEDIAHCINDAKWWEEVQEKGGYDKMGVER